MSNDLWNEYSYFPSNVYTMDKPEYLESVKKVSNDYLQKNSSSEVDELYPVIMTENIAYSEGIENFSQYILDTAWNILKSQGYQMNGLSTQFHSMWVQEHNKFSSMEFHVHGQGIQLVGFYFLECPENSSRVVFHDARLGKVMTSLPEENPQNATIASNMVNFIPEPGGLIFTNAHLPHSLTRNGSDKPFVFVHFNVIVAPNMVCQAPAEII